MPPVTSSAQAASFGEANICSIRSPSKTPTAPAGTEPRIRSQPVLAAALVRIFARQGRAPPPRDAPEVFSVEYEYGGERADVEQDVEEQPGFFQPQDALAQNEVARTAHRQKLGQALQDAENEGVFPEHVSLSRDGSQEPPAFSPEVLDHLADLFRIRHRADEERIVRLDDDEVLDPERGDELLVRADDEVFASMDSVLLPLGSIQTLPASSRGRTPRRAGHVPRSLQPTSAGRTMRLRVRSITAWSMLMDSHFSQDFAKAAASRLSNAAAARSRIALRRGEWAFSSSIRRAACEMKMPLFQ